MEYGYTHNSLILCQELVDEILISSMKFLHYLIPVMSKICLLLSPLYPIDHDGLGKVGELILMHSYYIHPGKIIIPGVFRCIYFPSTKWLHWNY